MDYITVNNKRYLASPNNKTLLAALNKLQKSAEEPPPALKLVKFRTGTYAFNPATSSKGS